MAPRQGTGFINWDQFVGANRGTVDRMAGELSAPVEAEGQRLSENLTAANRAFDTGVATAYNPLRSLQYGMPGGGTEGAAWAAREKQLLDAGSSAYGGPRSLADVGGFSEGLQAADKNSQAARNLADVYGRASALGQRYGASGRPYTGAARLFDSALLQSSPRQQRFEASRAQYGQQGNQYRQALGESAQAGEFAAGQYAEGAKGAREAGERMKSTREYEAERARQEAERDAEYRRRNPGAGGGAIRTPRFNVPGGIFGIPNTWGGLT